MMSFKNQIEERISNNRVQCMTYCYGGSVNWREVANSVLEMPEMQEIQTLLRFILSPSTVLPLAFDPYLRNMSDSLIHWALSEGLQ